MIQNVENAVILAAGYASRFLPYSLDFPKGLTTVKGEVLIERQIRQLLQAGITEIFVVTGYKQELFSYLSDQFPVKLIENKEYTYRNNLSSIYAVRNFLGNSYICSSDNYFMSNPFHREEKTSYYSGVFSDGPTKEWCMETDTSSRILSVSVGGQDAWYMLGHVFWNTEFSKAFLNLLRDSYADPLTFGYLWEDFYVKHIHCLPPLYLNPTPQNHIYEFDTLEELRIFDPECDRYNKCAAMEHLCQRFCCSPWELHHFMPEENGFSFYFDSNKYSSYDFLRK